MNLTIDLQPELAARLRDEAAKIGSDANTLIVQTLEERLYRTDRQPTPSHLPQEEADLVGKINLGLPEATWQEYHDLITKRRAETLTAEEHTRLIALSDRIDDLHANRLVSVAELARLRRVSLQDLMKQLDIKPRKV